jgi:glycosyltransferase involved in cell wall biosynthesis
MKDKVKVLFVVSEFWQGGAQRYIYEIEKNIDKNRFDITILSLRDLGSNMNWDDFYYEHYQQQGTPVYFFNEINQLQKYSLIKRIKRKLFNYNLLPERWPLLSFLNQFDKFVFIGEYTFPILEKYLNGEMKLKSFICVVNSIFQVPENYDKYDKSKEYNFISSFKNLNEEFKGFSKINHNYLPLSISFKEETRIWTSKNQKQKIIGIYTRLTKNKPLDVFFLALHLIRLQGIDIKLNIYGNGDPLELGILNNVEALSLNNYVQFKGHQENILDSAFNDNLDAVWAHSYYGFPGGFASMDISSVGIPQVFWNFTPNCENQMYEEFEVFKDINKFVEYNIRLLEDLNFSETIGKNQYLSIKKNNNIDENIKIIEEILTLSYTQNNDNI